MIYVFDFDGTLHRTDAVYGYAVRKVLKELSFSVPIPKEKLYATDKELSRYLGVAAGAMWEDFLPEFSGEERTQLIPRVGACMIEGIMAGETQLYEGIPELLDQLKAEGHTLLILSNCTLAYMEAQKQAHHLETWFCAFYCSEAYQNIPKEMIFEEILKDYPAEKEDYVIIGDRRSDIQVALVHHIRSIGCMYGYGSYEELADADILWRSPGILLR